MKILFAGAGALGSRLGYMLFKNNEDVTFIDSWEEHVENIKNKGLKVIIDDKDLGNYYIPTYRPDQVNGKFDVVFVATKSMQLRVMLEQVKYLFHEDTKIICILNGLGHVQTLKDYIKEENILIGVTVWTSGLGGPGVLNAHGTGKIELKQVKEVNLEKTLELVTRLNKAGLNIKYSDDTFQSIWHKAGLNCVLNTYCTLIDCNINQYGSFDKNLELTRAVLNEVTAVGKAEGIDVKQAVIEENIKNLFPLETAGAHYPSLYQDMKNGRLTEIDYLNGEVSRLGKIHNIPTPVCDIITLMIHSKEFINNNK
ncbi:MAG: ketopantoate reductase family protein [Gemella haemolysans]|uniref:ketopantoate reductase family protein n=1 Tax=Gemella haemolysans TaxID=1379 RepID=UPI00291322D2|nr:ketopantoate reductase family protein [Gemella haemolysans]MDU6573287.1 ketopantoate reductase family protein [Gemella haemolysans]